MSYIDVKNKKVTVVKNPPSEYTCWIEYWEMKRGRKAIVCEALSCTEKPKVGGFVTKSGDDGTIYLLPVCNTHNNKPETEIYKAWEKDLVSIE